MDIEQADFADQVKTLRHRLRLSQEEFAHALGVSFATVNRWENGKARPSKLALRQFTALLDKTNSNSNVSPES